MLKKLSKLFRRKDESNDDYDFFTDDDDQQKNINSFVNDYQNLPIEFVMYDKEDIKAIIKSLEELKNNSWDKERIDNIINLLKGKYYENSF